MMTRLLQSSVVSNHRTRDVAYHHNAVADLGDVPDACLHSDLALPSRINPFTEEDLSPLPVSVQEL